jgi:hypothetical protein
VTFVFVNTGPYPQSFSLLLALTNPLVCLPSMCREKNKKRHQPYRISFPAKSPGALSGLSMAFNADNEFLKMFVLFSTIGS